MKMWQGLLSIAKGHTSAYSAMQLFFSTVPWEELDHLSQSDVDFFKGGMFFTILNFFSGDLT
jgi:hypothetical protein